MSLPNFMCLGAAKSGTTTLYDILRQHPDIYIPSFKEPHFFDIPENYKNGIKWYEKTYFKNVNQKIVADFTPSYFFDEEAPKRIFESLGGELKFVVILRNPLDRAYSHYLHSKRDLYEKQDFGEALKLESSRLQQYQNQADYLSYLRHSYIHQGLYSKMLKRYLQYFSLDNFLFINFEDEFLQEKDLTIQKILHFLEIDSSILLNIDIRSNPASKERSKILKRMMKKTGWWRVLLKKMIPSLKIRQIIKNRIQRANISVFNPPKLTQIQRHNIYNSYFSRDVHDLSVLLNRDFSNWIS
ncbi:sulfotransferase domain-containing protein [Flavobacteriales bacterium]|jgi:hypothetical protein|nr:sulfotransferase domain-containing protein [Flavobacteriales bacterium]